MPILMNNNQLKLLNLNKTPKPDDAADALAIAICHLHSNKINSLMQ